MSRAARLAALVALVPACSSGAEGGATPDGALAGVVLVVADTLRADKLGCYGHDGGLTPALDAWARCAVLFQDASAHAPWTLPSVASLLTGQHPARHGAGGRLGAFRPLAPEVPTLAELFRAGGFQTAAVANVPFLAAPFGLERGFEHHDVELSPDNVQVRTAARTTDAALAWLAGRDPTRPFLLLVHYFDPHAVYDPPEPHRSRHAPLESGEDATPLFFGRREEVARSRLEGRSPEAGRIRRAERLYDGEVAYLDAEVGRLLAGLEALELDERSVVVFTADHGEEFLDHGDFEHGHTLYQELLAVPLLIRAPRVEAGIVATPVRQIDVAPTLLQIAGLPVPAGLPGRSLLPPVRGGPDGARPVLSHGSFWGEPWTALREGDHKLIRRPDGRVELYDLATDPREGRDLAGERSSLVERLTASLDALEGATGPEPAPAELSLDPDLRRLLEALGYGGR